MRKVLKLIAILFIILILFTAVEKKNKINAATGNFIFNIGLLDYGFNSIRNPDLKSIDKISLPRLDAGITISKSGLHKFEMGYSYDYILQSRIYWGFGLVRKRIKIGAGFSLGFYNSLPVKLIPGGYGTIQLNPFNRIKLYFYGYSSIFLKRLFSLESASSDFDQNILNIALYYQPDNVDIGFEYNNIYLYKLKTTYSINNSLKNYRFIIKTNLKNSLINSATTIGGSDSIYKTNNINNRLIQIYIDETLLIGLKSFKLNIGTQVNILSFTLKSIKSTSPPKIPYFNFHSGFTYIFAI